jgi:glycosyltransferase involved in cell wall biosynthesis
MSRAPLVSVVVPFHESERHIGACAESLLAQEGVGGPVEVLFVDNRSPDGSAALLERYPGLVVLREDTPGAYAARNTGIRRARAPVIAFTDADCVVARDWLESILGGMADPGVGVLLGRCLYPAEASLALRLLGAWEDAKAEYVVGLGPSPHLFAYANNMAVRASVFEEIGLFEEWPRAGESELVHRLAARRPDLRVGYRASMRVNHMEFLRARDRARRLSLYTHTNSRIGTFRELGLLQRLAILTRVLTGRPRTGAGAPEASGRRP